MPTPLTPDEEFDAHFRRGMEHYSGVPEAADTSDAWQRMEALLDAPPPPRHPRRRVRPLLGVLLLLLLVVGVSWQAQKDLRRRAASHAGHNDYLPTAGLEGPRAGATPQRLPTGLATHVPAAATTVPAPATGPAAATQGAASAAAASPVAIASAGSRAARQATGSNAAGPGNHEALTRLALLPHGPATARPQRQAAGNISASPASRRERWPAGEGPVAVAAVAGTTPTRPAGPAPGRQARPRAGAGMDAAPAEGGGHARLLPPRSSAATAAAQASSSAYYSLSKTCLMPPAPGAVARHQRARLGGFGRLPARAVATTAPAGRDNTAALAAYPLHEELLPEAAAGRPPQAVALLAGTGLPGWSPGPWAPALLPLPHTTPFDSLAAPKALPGSDYRLRIGLVAAPELSAVRQNGTGVGGSAGIQVAYQLARRWYLSTGYLQAVKRYVAAGGDYQLPTTWPSAWALDEVRANCRIIDVPLNLRYDVWQGPQRRAFVSGGLSSLFMRRENYDYQYYVAGKPYDAAWQLRNGTNHLLQVLNLTVGYEQRLSPRWSLQVEPYLKLPLGGIGYGAVRLQSAGVFFSLQYGLLRAPAAR